LTETTSTIPFCAADNTALETDNDGEEEIKLVEAINEPLTPW
jgi:hypothetical protein